MHPAAYVPPYLYSPRAAIVREESEHERVLREWDAYVVVPAEREPTGPLAPEHPSHHREHPHVTEVWTGTPNVTPSIQAGLPSDLAPMWPGLVSDLAWDAAA